jgi:FAD/FMN-containing dehydrogenase
MYTFVPTTVLGVQNVVLYAIERNLRVRCAGYRHSWAPIFGEGGELLISFVNLEQVTTVPDPVTIMGGEFSGQGKADLKSVELVSGAAPGKQLVKAGAAVTSEDFRRWQLDNKWVLPVDTLLVEVTMGGVASGICHGAGIKHNAIPDYVRSIEYVDCKGNLQVVDSSTPKLLSVAAGNFGLVRLIASILECLYSYHFQARSHHPRHFRTRSNVICSYEAPKNRYRPGSPSNT